VKELGPPVYQEGDDVLSRSHPASGQPRVLGHPLQLLAIRLPHAHPARGLLATGSTCCLGARPPDHSVARPPGHLAALPPCLKAFWPRGPSTRLALWALAAQPLGGRAANLPSHLAALAPGRLSAGPPGLDKIINNYINCSPHNRSIMQVGPVIGMHTYI
jgi:hypothetical protein